MFCLDMLMVLLQSGFSEIACLSNADLTSLAGVLSPMSFLDRLKEAIDFPQHEGKRSDDMMTCSSEWCISGQ
jgi:hypothetical protein